MTMMVNRQPGTIKNGKFHLPNNQQISDSLEQSRKLIINLSNMKNKSIPQTIQNCDITNIKQLILDNNNIQQCALDTKIFYKLKILSIQRNNMQKFTIKRSLIDKYNLQLTSINLSYNKLQFLDLTCATKLTKILLHNNCLSTIILPQMFLESLDISFNLFSNIQYSVLSGKVFSKLIYLNVSYNNKSLYDLILTVNGVQLIPSLVQLDCSHNILSYFQSLPTKIKTLNLEQNQFIFDRRAVNEIIKLRHLQCLKLSGNTISQNFLQLIKTKLERDKDKKVQISSTNDLQIKQSPYKLYEQLQTHQKNKTTQKIINNNFTLGQQLEIDPDYNLVSAHDTKNNHNHVQNQHNNHGLSSSSSALLATQNKLKPQKFKINIDGDRFHNHYKYYFDKLSQFMSIPPYPILHQDRNKNISIRIDPSHDKDILNQFDLINEMFRKKGGVHYVRKVFNWDKSQQIKKYFPASVMFICLELNRYQFSSLCDGDCTRIDVVIQQKHCLNYQPSSFSIYHILAKIGLSQYQNMWSCLYLIEAAQL